MSAKTESIAQSVEREAYTFLVGGSSPSRLTKNMNSSKSNTFNQKQYQENAQAYLNSNVTAAIGGGNPELRVAFLATVLPSGRRVLEIGSGGGNDALALQKAGYDVLASDFVQSFVDTLKTQGLNALYLDAKNDPIPSGFDAVYANAVFVHFSPEEVRLFLKKAKISLQNEKILFISVLKGEGSERSARGRGFERDFHYYTLTSLTLLMNEEGFDLIAAKDDNDKWLQAIVKPSTH